MRSKSSDSETVSNRKKKVSVLVIFDTLLSLLLCYTFVKIQIPDTMPQLAVLSAIVISSVLLPIIAMLAHSNTLLGVGQFVKNSAFAAYLLFFIPFDEAQYGFYISVLYLQVVLLTSFRINLSFIAFLGFLSLFVINGLLNAHAVSVYLWSGGIGVIALIGKYQEQTFSKQHRQAGADVSLQLQRENTLIKMLEDVDLLVFGIDARQNVTYWNNKCERLTGYTYDEISSKPEMLKLLFADEADYIRFRNIIFAEKPVLKKFETRIVNRFGKRLIISWAMYESQTNPGSRFIGRDITENYRTWKTIEKNKQQLADIQSISKIGLWEWTPNEGRINLSDEMYKMFGLPVPKSNEQQAKALMKVVTRENTVRIMRNLKNSLENNSDIAMEYDIMLPTGESRTMFMQGALFQNSDGDIRKYKGTNQDITEIKRAEQKSRNIIHASPDAIIVTDKDLIIKDYNRTAYHIFDLRNLSSLRGSVLDLAAHEADKARLQKQIADRNRNVIIETEEFELITTTNKIFPAEISAGIIGKFESPDAYVFFVKDISKRKDREDALNLAKLKAEQSDRLKSAFLANISHEIRTPLNAIVGFANLITDDDLSSDLKKEYAGYVSSNSATLTTLISDIMDISRIESGEIELKYQPVEIVKFIQTVKATAVENQKKFFKDKLFIETEIDNILEEQYFESDKVRLKQVLDNLMHNAIKFSDSGKVTLACNYVDNVLKFSVKDEGQGIREGDLKRIFERFVKIDTHEDFKRGTGLGLTISAELVRLLGGKLNVNSQYGVGSVFHFGIETNLFEHKPSFSDNEYVASKYIWAKNHILIAEDEEINFLFLKAVLAPTGIKISRATNGADAVSIVRNNPSIQLVIMDIGMPVMDGYEATRQIKMLASNLPVIVQSAFAMADEHQKMKNAGCDSFISKPINRNKLLREIALFLPKL